MERSRSLPELARESNLISAIQRDIEAIGVIGEADCALLIYAAGSSRLLKHPLRLIVRGPSSSGKSHAQKKVTQMFPRSAIVEATSMSPMALYRMQADSLKHKLIVAGERSHRTDEEQADKTAAIRQLISEDRISRLVAVKVKGDWQTRRIEQEGPIAFVEVTTSESIFAEDANRCLQVHVDDSQEQTKRIMQAVAQQYSGEARPNDIEAVLQRHHEFQESLEYANVVIPYAADLAERLPAQKVEARRAFKHILATIEVIAFLHQHHRPRDDRGRLIATEDDYAIARRMVSGAVNESLGHGDRTFKAYTKLRETFPDHDFTSAEAIATGCFANRMTCSRVLKQLMSLQALLCLDEGGPGRPSRWRWTATGIAPAMPERIT